MAELPDVFKPPEPAEQPPAEPGELWTPLLDVADEARPIFARAERRYWSVARFHAVQPVSGGAQFEVEGDGGQRMRVAVTFVDPHVVRVRLDTGSGWYSADPILFSTPPVPLAEVRLEQGADEALVCSEALAVRVHHEPWRLSIEDGAGRTLFAEQTDDRTFFARVAYPLGYSEAEQGGRRVHESVALGRQEALYGLGQQYGPLNKRGQRLVAWSRDTKGTNTTDVTYLNVQFLLSSAGYGLFLAHTEPIVWELGAPSAPTASFQVEAEALDYFVIHGPSPKEVLGRYTALTGRPPLPPLWSFGVWFSRCMYESRAQVEEVVTRARQEGFPLDVIHLDPLWLRDRRRHKLDACDFEWCEERFPDPAGLIAWLRERGVRLSLWENPYVWFESDLFRQGAPRGYFVRARDGAWARALDNPDAALVDYTNPEAVAWIKEQHRRWHALGVASFKSDYGEGLPPDAVLHDGRSGRQAHNVYPLYFNRAVFEAARETLGEAVVFGRSGWAGSQRYPLNWSGDAQSTWEGLAGALRGGLSLALSGFAYWTSDVGGFWDVRHFQLPDPELYLRWAQLALLCSHTRFHGVLPREPWEFGPEVLRIVRDFARLRYRLLPYLWSLAHQAAATGLPLLRPLLLEYPDDRVAREVDDQFLLGPWLLVAPLLAPAREREVYLPPGRWYDFWTNEEHDGGRWLTCPAPLERVPLFVRDDSLLPFGPEMDYVGQRPWDTLQLDARVGQRAELRLPLPEGGELWAEAWRRGTRLTLGLRTPRPLRLAIRVPSPDARAVWQGEVQAAESRREGAWLLAAAIVSGAAELLIG